MKNQLTIFKCYANKMLRLNLLMTDFVFPSNGKFSPIAGGGMTLIVALCSLIKMALAYKHKV